MKDARLTDCPQAGCIGPVQRKIGRGAGIIFKGSGFYQTDYRSESYKAAAKKDGAGSASSSSSASSGSATSSSSSSSSSGAAPSPAAS